MWFPSGIVVDFVHGTFIRVDTGSAIYRREIDNNPHRPVYQVYAHGERRKVAESWEELDPRLREAVQVATRTLAAHVEGLKL